MCRTALEAVCNHLKVEIGEVWDSVDGNRYCILSDGYIQILDKAGNEIGGGHSCWKYIFRGLIKPIWIPKSGEDYYTSAPNASSMYIGAWWSDSEIDKIRYERGLVFKTKDEAVQTSKKMLQTLKEEQ